jgi:small subunit ribosomal protein S2
MREITLEELLEAGCHFGHQVNRQNPRAAEFIFEARNNVHIINLEATHAGLIAAAEYLKKLAADGKNLVIVGTKRQVRPVVEEEVARAREAGVGNLFYVTSRWIGGVLTNYFEISKNFKRLAQIEEILADKDSGYTKREKLLMEREKEKLVDIYGGIRDLKTTPDALLIIDTHHEDTAVHEGHLRNVPIVGVVDTNADPSEVAYAIPSNDDAVGAVKLLMNYLMDAWIEGAKQGEGERAKDEEEKKVAKEKADKAEIPVVESKQSEPAEKLVEKTDKKEAEATAEKTTKAKSKEMDTKPAVKKTNREKAGKTI